ncbi:MAG: c-type cytochrome [Planctomycetota bacterium]
MASQRYQSGAISAAQGWLRLSTRFTASDPRTDLLAAACFRSLGRQDRWRQSLEAARAHGADPQALQLEATLAAIRAGEIRDGMELEMGALNDAGAAPSEIGEAFVRGYLARGTPLPARQFLEAWTQQGFDTGFGEYLWGLYWRNLGDTAKAEKHLRAAIAHEPRRESAGVELAELYEQRSRLDLALAEFIALATRSPKCEAATLGLARTLRKLGRFDDARAMLHALDAGGDENPAVHAELGQLALDTGDYRQAETRLRPFIAAYEVDDAWLEAAACALALRPEPSGAEELFDRIESASWRRARMHDLRTRLALTPADTGLTAELHRLRVESRSSAPSAAESARNATASGLYMRHCSACHGFHGNGDGRAARHLTPRPRDLRRDHYRIVSSRDGVPSIEDVAAVLKSGLPGTSMPGFPQLTAGERTELAREILGWRREEIRARTEAAYRDESEPIDENEVREIVELQSEPHLPVALPKIWDATGNAVDRGRKLYLSTGCASCHGGDEDVDGDGENDAAGMLFDERDAPSWPRELRRDPMKGGEEREAIFLRIAVGMPGTPHPAAASLGPDDVAALVAYCLSLRRHPVHRATNDQRARKLAVGIASP